MIFEPCIDQIQQFYMQLIGLINRNLNELCTIDSAVLSLTEVETKPFFQMTGDSYYLKDIEEKWLPWVKGSVNQIKTIVEIGIEELHDLLNL